MTQNRIKELREQHSVTQKELGELSGVPYHTVTKIEQGVVIPRVDTALSLAKALQSTVEEIFHTRRGRE